MLRADKPQSNQLLPPVGDNGRDEVNSRSSLRPEKSRLTGSITAVERSNSFDEPANHTEVFCQRLVRGSGEETEGNARRSIHDNATTTSDVTTRQALAYQPMTRRGSSLVKAGEKCEEPFCPRITDDSNTASGTTESISHLIKLRDDMIAAKNEEVLLLSKQNQCLREGMDAIETEMEALHGAVEAKDGTIQKLRRETDRLHREIKRLQMQGEERRGEQNAIALAAVQNNRLLKLLEQEEFNREGVLRERDEAVAEIDELKNRVKTSDKQHAERTTDLEMKLIDALKEKPDLAEKYTQAEERLESLEAELEKTKNQVTFEREISKTELNGRRQGHYELLNQLQESRDELQREKDYSETAAQDLEVCRRQNAELERRLATVQNDLSNLERRSREQELKADEDARMLDARLSKETSLTESLQDKLADMGRMMLQLAQRLKDQQSEVSRRDSEKATLRDQVQQADSRELRLKQKIIRLESQLDLEATQKHLHNAIETFNRQTSHTIPVASSKAIASPKQVSPEIAGGIGNAMWSRRQILWKFLEFFKVVSSYHANEREEMQKSIGMHVATELDLSECGLEDEDVVELMDLVHSFPLLTSLNMSMNYLGDRAVAFIADAFRHPTCRLKTVDLRYNQISMEGVRELAKALEGCRRQDVAHVYVHREGRIDVLGRRPGNSDIREEDDQGRERDPLESFFSVMVVDVRDNKPPSDGITPVPVARRGKAKAERIRSIKGRRTGTKENDSKSSSSHKKVFI